MAVLHYVNGNLADKDFELMDEPLESDGEAVSTLVRQYYSARGAWPKFIYLPECAVQEDLEALAELFSKGLLIIGEMRLQFLSLLKSKMVQCARNIWCLCGRGKNLNRWISLFQFSSCSHMIVILMRQQQLCNGRWFNAMCK